MIPNDTEMFVVSHLGAVLPIDVLLVPVNVATHLVPEPRTSFRLHMIGTKLFCSCRLSCKLPLDMKRELKGLSRCDRKRMNS